RNHGDNNEDTETNINNNEIVEITQTNNVIMPTVETYQPIDNNQNNQSLNNIHRKDELVIIPMQEQEIIITASEDEPATIPTIFAHQNSKGKWTNQEVVLLDHVDTLNREDVVKYLAFYQHENVQNLVVEDSLESVNVYKIVEYVASRQDQTTGVFTGDGQGEIV
ncbi:2334_t:CDS:2, partial [Entrophospora sp. SA101]